jgi:hypothetical protein
LRYANPRRAEGQHTFESDCDRELGEGDRRAAVHWLLSGQLVVSSPEVLDEGMPGDDHPGAVVLFEPAHRPQPRLQPAVICFDVVVAIPVSAMLSRWQQRAQHGRVHRRGVGDDLHRRRLRGADGVLEEPAGRRGIPSHGDEDVDDLPELVDRPVRVAPRPATFT